MMPLQATLASMYVYRQMSWMIKAKTFFGTSKKESVMN